MRDSRIIAVTNQKGGVGKTTTAVNLGVALASGGKRVLLVDNDPQGNMTASMGLTAAEQRYTLANLLLAAIDYPEDLELHKARAVVRLKELVDIIPSNGKLADAAARLQVMQLSQYSVMSNGTQICEGMLRMVLASFREIYDYIIIDCGLKFELLTVNALVAADYCIIPVQSHFLASEGIPEVLELMNTVKERFNPNLKLAGILLTMYQSRPQLCQSIREIVREVYGEDYHVFERPIEYAIRVAECPAHGKSILEYDIKCPAAESYLCLAEEVRQLG